MNKQNTVLLIGDVNSPHIHKWIKAIAQHFRVVIFSIDQLYEQNRKYVEIDNVVVYASQENTSNSRSVLTYLKHLKRLRQIIKKEQPFVTHAHYATSYGMLGVLTKKTTFCISTWGSDIYFFPKKTALHRFMLKWILKKTDHIFATSQHLASETNLYTKKQILVIPFGIDTTLFSPKKISKNELFTVGTVKALEHVYGIDRLIEVFTQFNKKYPNSRCLIYGKGTQKDTLQQQINELGMQNAIILKGFVANNKVPEAIAEFDVYCALSRRESFGVAVIEASACEVPVIVSNADGLPEVVKHEKTGYIVFGDDQKEIVGHLEKLYLDVNLRKQMGKNGRKFVQENYEWEEVAQKQIDFYYSLLKK